MPSFPKCSALGLAAVLVMASPTTASRQAPRHTDALVPIPAMASAGVPLSPAAMATVRGGWVTWATIVCIGAGTAVTAGTGQLWAGILTTLECNDILAPQPLN